MLTLILILSIKKVIVYIKTKHFLAMLVQKFNSINSGLILLILFSGLTIISNNSAGQQLNYDVIKGGNNIGKIHMDCVQIKDRLNYTFDSDVKVSFILTFDVTTKYFVSFERNVMLQSRVVQKINGHEKINNLTQWNGKFYVLKQKDENNSAIKNEINYSTTCLYYSEPINIKTVFSESLQKVLSLKALANHRYVLELPNGNETFYSYTNGICTLVEAHTDLAVIKFVLDESSMLANNLIKK